MSTAAGVSRKRDERDGFDAVAELLEGLGLPCAAERGGKHLMAVTTLASGGQLRFPIPGSPGHGQGGSAWLAVRSARKVLRQHGFSL